MSAQLPYIQIEGRSGCRLEILNTDEKVIVRKYASNVNYNARLKLQEQKQRDFNTKKINALGFYSPDVYLNGTEDGLHWFDMKFIGGEKYSNYLISITKTALDGLVQKLINYLKLGFDNSELKAPPMEIIQQKIKHLSGILEQNADIPTTLTAQIINYLYLNIPQSNIYNGKCHGDFTLSNMLFSKNGEIVTFDLLDSFIESPIIDLVKLRQDTKYHWSLFIENNQLANKVKIKQVLAYIDYKIMQTFANDICLKNWEKYLTVFNFARILPYAKDNRDINYLNTHITNLLHT